MKKPNKENYLLLRAYYLILFLLILSKVLKYLVAKKSTYLYNAYKLFLKNYFDSLKYKNTLDALVIL